jgi:N-hydroxyarylamine O-acetyltransferase
VDLDAYFARIGYTGARTPTLDTLAAIHFLHPQAIPFETLDALARKPPALDLPSLERKLVHSQRGGWCFEQNLLLQNVLETLGFRVKGLAARVMYNTPGGTIRPRSHMLLRINDEYVADVGFGGLTLTGPLRLITGVEQATPHEHFRLMRQDELFVMEALVQNTWKPLYSFDLQPQHVVDYEVSNWHLATHPQSHFTHNLLVARVTPERRYGLFNKELSIHHLHGESQRITLASDALLQATLEQTFNIRTELPGHTF